MTDSTFGFVGFGLIGGSIAKGIKRRHPQATIMAYMRSQAKLEQARNDGIVDIILDDVDEHLKECDIIFLCMPVEFNISYLARIQPFLKPGAILTDVGSTKTKIHEAVTKLGLADCFIGGHPMAGSEKFGYENATDRLLEKAYYIITPAAGSDQTNIDRMVAMATTIGSLPIVLNYREHDRVVAAISHLPHIIASSLVNLVQDNDNPQTMMKRLAAGGFKDITRIASSSPEMWEQICMTNTDHIVAMLETYIVSLTKTLNNLKQHDSAAIHQLFDTSRTYRNSITDTIYGSVAPDYSFTVDVADEPGSISTMAVILSARGISIRNIGINHNREHGEYALKITFYDEAAMNAAWEQLLKFNYELYRIQ